MPPPHAITLSLAFIEPPAPYFQLHFRDGITPFRRRHYISYAMNMMAFRRQLSKRATLIHYAIDAEILKRAAFIAPAIDYFITPLIMPTLADSQLILITPLTLMPFSLAAEY
jgi:hypothetical protein